MPDRTVEHLRLHPNVRLSRLPLLFPVCLWVLALMMVRTDALPIPHAALLIAVVALGLLLWRRWLLLVVLLLGCIWSLADLALDARAIQVDQSWLGKPQDVRATVEAVQAFPTSTRLRLSHIRRDDGTALRGEALLYLYAQRSSQGVSGKAVAAGNLQQSVKAGDQIGARVRLHLPRNYLNPGSFDYQAWCFDRHISALGSISGQLRVIEAANSWLESARQRVRNAIAEVAPEAGGVLYAVLLGDRNRISASANDAFAATGTAHLLAISGMHVGMAAAWLFALCWWVMTRREAWIVHFPVRTLSLAAGFLAAVAYATMAGWPLPAVRASIMLGAGVLAWQMAARAEPLNTLLAALLLILLVDPSSVSSVSLWLSFLATAGVLLWAGHHQSDTTKSIPGRAARAVRGLFWVSLLAMLATLPMIVSVFGRVPLYGLLANMLLVPVYGLFVMPLGLAGELAAVLGLHALAGWLFQICSIGIEQGLLLIAWIAAWPAGRLWAISPGWMLNGLYGLGAIGMILMLLKGSARWLVSLLAALGVAAYLLVVLTEKEIETPVLVAWDVGQGAASTLLLPGRQVLAVDVPGRDGSRFNGGGLVAAGLREMGVTHVDVLALTHAQSDHLGGALSLMGQLNDIGEIWLPDVPAARADRRVKLIVAAAGKRRIPVRWLARGDSFRVGGENSGMQIKVLWPPRNHAPANANNASLVLAGGLPNGALILWPGDIEAEAEAEILKDHPISIDVMLVPHHGSKTSSSPDFVHAMSPSISIAQTGFLNRYGFPQHNVVARYQAEGSLVLNTAQGAVIASWPGELASVQVEQWRPSSGLRRELALHWYQ